MAFGDVKGTLTGGNASIPATLSATGSVVVVVGDLIVGVVAEQTSLTTSSCGDNQAGAASYTASNAGTLSGTAVSGRMYYRRVTAAGTITSVNAVCTSSTHDGAMCAAVFEGPFLGTFLDTNPVNVTNDVTTPYNAPTGTIGQSNALLVAWMATNTTNTYTAVSPSFDAANFSQSANANTAISGRVVTTNAANTAGWTGTAATANVLGATAFRGPIGKTLTATQTQTVTLTRVRGLARIISITQAQAVTLTRIVRKTITLIQTQAVSGTLIATRIRTIQYSGLNEVVTLQKSVGKLISLTQIQSVSGTLIATIVRVVQYSGLNEVVTLQKSTRKLITFIQAQLVSLIATKTGTGTTTAKTITFTQTQLVTLRKSVGKLINLTQAQLVTLQRSARKLITLTQNQLVTLTRVLAYLRTITITQPQLVTLTRGTSHLRTILIAQTQSVTLLAQKSFLRTITLTQTQLVTLRKSSGKLIVIVQTQLVTLRKSVMKFIILTQTQLVTLRNSMRKLITFTQAQAVSGTLVATIARTIQYNGLSELITLQKRTGKLISFTQIQSVSGTLIATIFRVVQYSGLSEAITLIAAKTGTSTAKTIIFTQNQLLTLATTYLPGSAAQLIHNLPFLTTPGKIRSF